MTVYEFVSIFFSGHSMNKRQKKDEPAPQKLMDDLFLKTKATPSIYWQPLSPEEVSTNIFFRYLIDMFEEVAIIFCSW